MKNEVLLRSGADVVAIADALGALLLVWQELFCAADRRAVTGAYAEHTIRQLERSLASGIWGWFDETSRSSLIGASSWDQVAEILDAVLDG